MADVRRGAKSEQQPGRSFIAGFSARTSDPEPPISVFHSSSGDAEIERVTQSVQLKINREGWGAFCALSDSPEARSSTVRGKYQTGPPACPR